MNVLATPMFVSMDVELFRGKQFSQGVDAEKDQHASNQRFEFSLGRLGDLQFKKDNEHADREQRNSMPNAPKASDQRCGKQTFLLANDRRDRREMISLDRMLQTEDETDQQN